MGVPAPRRTGDPSGHNGRVDVTGASARTARWAVAYSAVRAAVHVMFGNSPDILVEFGLTQRRTARARTLDEKVVARDKRDLTRAARHDMGNKQRAAIRPAPPEPIPTAPQPAAQAPAIPPSPSVPQSLVNGAGSH